MVQGAGMSPAQRVINPRFTYSSRSSRRQSILQLSPARMGMRSLGRHRTGGRGYLAGRAREEDIDDSAVSGRQSRRNLVEGRVDTTAPPAPIDDAIDDHPTSGRLADFVPEDFEIAPTEPQVRLHVVSLGPLVPGLEKGEPIRRGLTGPQAHRPADLAAE